MVQDLHMEHYGLGNLATADEISELSGGLFISLLSTLPEGEVYQFPSPIRLINSSEPYTFIDELTVMVEYGAQTMVVLEQPLDMD